MVVQSCVGPEHSKKNLFEPKLYMVDKQGRQQESKQYVNKWAATVGVMGHDGCSADGELGTRSPRSRSPKHLRGRRGSAPNAVQETVILDAYYIALL